MKQLMSHPYALYFVYTFLAVGVFFLLSGVWQLLRRSENKHEARNRRMKMIAGGATAAEILAVLKPVERGGWITRLPFVGDLPKAMRQAGMTSSPTLLILICLSISAVISAMAAMKVTLWMAIAIGVTVGFLLPIGIIRHRRAARIEAITKLLPEALDLMSRGLRVGHPLNTSIASVAEQMPDPIGSEFGLIADQVSFGDDLVDAFAEFADRIDIEDVHYLSASLGIQHGTGGDLARVLDVLSKVVKNRIAMRRRIQAISAEGRLSSYFLSAIPVFIFVSTSISNPRYYQDVYDDPLFIPMAIAVVTFTVLNAVILAKLVRFRI
ncbi:type II secretion system F family protein [Falsihalocynthiibacter arcticus]|uniref:Uncharacterized protein n=1 Tax=Falsihalocynthiibacter arcticus TaxID=1579316 RepID=A0A126V228_9RHOB|nr:type II secretion system F family protein [Falsihalocynthiibacter arcticus]AML52381.1 hypothetical protein RC74_14835 [Falsihalocynthiibacter arcticus]